METIFPGHYVRFARSKTEPAWKVLELSDDRKLAKLKAVSSNQIRWAEVDKLKLSDLSFSWGDENLGVDVDAFVNQSEDNSKVLIRDSYTDARYHLADIELPKTGKRKPVLPIYKAKNR